MIRKRTLILVGSVLLSVAAGGLFGVRAGWFPSGPKGSPTELSFDELGRDSGYVRVDGTAHYPVRIKQTFQPTWLHSDPPPTHVFPLFSQGDTLGRDIRILVISQQEPDRILGYEDRSIQGEIRRPTSRLLTRGVLDTFREQDYGFEDDFLLLIEDPS